MKGCSQISEDVFVRDAVVSATAAKEIFIEAAALSMEPEEIEKITGAKFFEGRDDLDYFMAARFRMDDGMYFYLENRHRHPSLKQQTYICFSNKVTDYRVAVSKVLDALGIGSSRLVWQQTERCMYHRKDR